ncbi:hypothetical protein AMJ49_01220 [Parcubacteria bacterium DG_74_2]|nr:MAG: hypothetical protein AMJ49_01220 [Parcubacteria bacterium DG_74_2]
MTKQGKINNGALEKKRRPEDIVLKDIVIPFLREDLGYKFIDPRLQRVPIRFGRETKYADTVVYIIKNAKKIPHIVVESKAPNEPLDWEQAESYAQRLRAPYFLVTDGKTWHWYQTGERQGESEIIKNVPEAPRYMEKENLIAFEDLNELQRVVGKCHDIIRNEEGFDPTIAFDEISKLLFAKTQDEREVNQGFKDDKGRTPKNDYEFGIEKDELPEEIGTRVKTLFERAKNKYPEIFEGTTEDIKYIKLRFPTIFHIVQELQNYTLQETTIDIKGATYELFIKGTFTGKGLGQFFTPREIVEFMVDMLEPKRRDFILDPACGSGGFLITCMKMVFDEIDDLYRQRGVDNPKKEKWGFATQHLYGTDINERMTWVAKMNMVMHGDGHGGIFNHDGLKDSERIELIIDIVKKKDGFDMVLTNPPFGSRIKSQDILARYKLGEKHKEQLTEALFIERCLNLLKSNGILAIIVPDGTILNNPSSQDIRKFIIQRSFIEAIVSLPSETFIPYGSTQKTSIIFLKKKATETEVQTKPVFMAIADTVGFDSVGRKIDSNDLIRILERHDAYRKNGEKALAKIDQEIGIKKLRLSEIADEFPADDDEKGFLVSFSDDNFIRRMDVEYYRPKIKRLLKLLKNKNAKKINEVVEPPVEREKIKEPDDLSTVFRYIERIDSKTGKIIYGEKPFNNIPQGARFIFRYPCIIVSRINAKIGCVAILPKDLDGILGTNEYYTLCPKREVDIDYLHEILRSNVVKQQILVRTSGLFTRLHEEQLRKILLPLPVPAEQVKIKEARSQAESMKREAKHLEREALTEILKKFE